MTSRSNAAPGRFGLLDVVVLIAMAVIATAFAAGLIINSGIDMMAGAIAGAALFVVLALRDHPPGPLSHYRRPPRRARRSPCRPRRRLAAHRSGRGRCGAARSLDRPGRAARPGYLGIWRRRAGDRRERPGC